MKCKTSTAATTCEKWVYLLIKKNFQLFPTGITIKHNLMFVFNVLNVETYGIYVYIYIYI